MPASYYPNYAPSMGSYPFMQSVQQGYNAPMAAWPQVYPLQASAMPMFPYGYTQSGYAPQPYFPQQSQRFVPPQPQDLAPAERTSMSFPRTTNFTEVKARHILVKTRAEAEKYRNQILGGRSFAEIAKKVSLCPSGKEGGDLGFFAKGQMVPEFDKVAFKLPIGVVSEPIKTDFGWHLIQVTDHK